MNAAAASFDASQRGAKKRAILTVLSRSNGGVTTQMIISEIAHMGLVATVENTSPQISAYKADGFVDLAADGWIITKKGREYLAEKN